MHTVKQTAEYFKVSTQTIRRWAKDGCPHIMVGKVFRFDFAEVKKWLEERSK